MPEVREDTRGPEVEERDWSIDSDFGLSWKEHQQLWGRVSSIKSRIKRGGLECDMNPWLIHFLIIQDCEYCGDPPYQDRKMHGLDRVDPSKGYLRENVVTCCWKCNRAKSDMLLGDWLEHMRKVLAHIAPR